MTVSIDPQNFMLEGDLDIDFSTDLYNYAHINVYGATKYTLYFANYLAENYDLQDHRGDSDYFSWDSEYERFKESYYELTGHSFDDLLNSYIY